jgi:hypothetical protein
MNEERIESERLKHNSILTHRSVDRYIQTAYHHYERILTPSSLDIHIQTYTNNLPSL